MSDAWNIRGRWNSLAVTGDEPAKAEVADEAPAEAEPAFAASRTKGTFIGSGALFEGTLRLKGDFCIDSEFHGALDTDGTLTVGPSGSVEGNIRAREVIVTGAVVGDIVGRRQVIVRAGARLHGDIETACLEIERHAYFVGRSAMTRPHADPRPAPPDETIVVKPGTPPTPPA